MSAKTILTGILGLFVAAAVIVIARQAIVRTQDQAVNAAIVAPAVAAAPAVRVAVSEAATPPEPTAVAGTAESNEPPEVAVPAEPVAKPAQRVREETPPPPLVPAHKVIAMYFHGNVRCATCRKVEAYAREAIDEGFPAQIAAGAVEFRPVNVEQPENRHFIEDYQLVNKSVVVVDERDGAAERWVKLDNVWALVGDHDAYLLYVQDAVRAYVESE